MAGEKLTVAFEGDVTQDGRTLLREAEVVAERNDLLPILGCMVHDAGEFLHESGGTDGRRPSEHARALRDNESIESE